MRNINIRILFSLIVVVCLCASCKKTETRSKVLLNEVLVNNESNFQDDYGVNSAWIELFNRSYGTTDIAGYSLKYSDHPGDTITYVIPKGDVQTQVKPRQHTLFWADGKPTRGTFHTNFTLDSSGTFWLGLYNSGKMLIDSVTVPGYQLKANESWARESDALSTWEVKGRSEDKYVTPSTNNKVINTNPKMENFGEQDSSGRGMAISAMCVVFSALLLLFIVFRFVGNASVRLTNRNAMKAKGITDTKDAGDDHMGHVPGEVYAAIALAMHEIQSDVHDVEETTLTIARVQRSYSPWSSKIYTLRELPHKK